MLNRINLIKIKELGRKQRRSSSSVWKQFILLRSSQCYTWQVALHILVPLWLCVCAYVRLCVEVEAENWWVTWGMMEATALGKKLFRSLVVLVFEVQYHYPDGEGTNREWPRWVTSALMFLTFLCRRSAYTESRSGSAAPTILRAVLTTWDRSFLFSTVQLEYHTMQHWLRMLCVVLLKKFLS